MHLLAALLTVLPMTFVAQDDDPAAIMARAEAAYNAKEYEKCATLYEQAIKAGAAGQIAPYNAACCHALRGAKDEAFAMLGKAIEAGWRNAGHLRADSDLKSLHDDPRWPGVIQRCEEQSEKYAPSVGNPDLRKELLRRMELDQSIRMAEKPDMAAWIEIDAANTEFMQRVIEEHGWPGKSMVGDDGALAAFLLVQHADAQPAFQKECLPLLKEAAEKGEARLADMAYLTDRVLVAEGKPQRYGSQFHTVDGKLQPRPIEDPENLDARRKAVGLGSMAEYIKQMESMYEDRR